MTAGDRAATRARVAGAEAPADTGGAGTPVRAGRPEAMTAGDRAATADPTARARRTTTLHASPPPPCDSSLLTQGASLLGAQLELTGNGVVFEGLELLPAVQYGGERGAASRRPPRRSARRRRVPSPPAAVALRSALERALAFRADAECDPRGADGGSRGRCRGGGGRRRVVAAGADRDLRPGERPARRLSLPNAPERERARRDPLARRGPALRLRADARLGVAALRRQGRELARAVGPSGRRRAARDGDDHRWADRRGVWRGRPRGARRDGRRPRPARAGAAGRLRGARRDRERLHRGRRRRQHRRPRSTGRCSSCASSAITRCRSERRSRSPRRGRARSPRWRSAWTSAPTRSCCGRRAARSTRAGSRTPAPSTRCGRSDPPGYAPQLAAVLSDNNHAFAMWTDEPPPGVSATATIYLEHSGDHVTFGPPHALVSFTEPAQQRLTPGSLALVRMSPSEGVLAAWTSVSDANYVVSAAGMTSARSGRHPDAVAARRRPAPRRARRRAARRRGRRARERAARVTRFRRDQPGDPRVADPRGRRAAPRSGR